MIKDLLPPIFTRVLLRIVSAAPVYGFVGEYASFQSALAASTGYETNAYANPSAEQLRTLLSEVPSPKIDERFLQVHSMLSFIAQTEGATRLSVLDIGGGNGAYAFVMKRLLQGMALDWTVLETRPVVDACRNIPGAPCKFTDDAGMETFDVALISGALQYLPHPIEALRDYAKHARWIILTRVPVIDGAGDKLTVQIVPAHLHSGSMPVWLFSTEKLQTTIDTIGTVLAEWEISPDASTCATAGARPAGYLIHVRP